MCYAIQVIGYGARRRYAIQEVNERGTNPTNGRSYKTLDAAKAAADDMGVLIDRIGDYWEIIDRV